MIVKRWARWSDDLREEHELRIARRQAFVLVSDRAMVELWEPIGEGPIDRPAPSAPDGDRWRVTVHGPGGRGPRGHAGDFVWSRGDVFAGGFVWSMTTVVARRAIREALAFEVDRSIVEF